MKKGMTLKIDLYGFGTSDVIDVYWSWDSDTYVYVWNNQNLEIKDCTYLYDIFEALDNCDGSITGFESDEASLYDMGNYACIEEYLNKQEQEQG